MIFLIVPILSLMISFFLPWPLISALAAGVYSFRAKKHLEVLLLSLGIFTVHLLVSLYLDFNADGLISMRLSGLLGFSPLSFLFYILVALVPSLVFLMSSYVVLESRALSPSNRIKTRLKMTEKKG